MSFLKRKSQEENILFSTEAILSQWPPTFIILVNLFLWLIMSQGPYQEYPNHIFYEFLAFLHSPRELVVMGILYLLLARILLRQLSGSKYVFFSLLLFLLHFVISLIWYISLYQELGTASLNQGFSRFYLIMGFAITVIFTAFLPPIIHDYLSGSQKSIRIKEKAVLFKN